VQATTFSNALMSLTQCADTGKAAVAVPHNYAKELVTGLLCILCPWTYDVDTHQLAPIGCSAGVETALATCPDFQHARGAASTIRAACDVVARSLDGREGRDAAATAALFAYSHW
jgi:hypothetical protein